ncbi:MAG: hypothetical protein QGF46_08960, partial [Planctomycetota bacterium]|nr:hypothetical protein [Planctomycetota bacterium]
MATATVHNALATVKSPAGPELILVSAQAGVTFAHGNAPGCEGTYKPLDGVSANRIHQNQDAYQLVKEQTGVEGWKHTSDYYLNQGLNYWAQNPTAAVGLFFKKFRLLFSSDNYGDLFLINAELSDEAWPRPVPHLNFAKTGWLLPLSCLALVLLWRQQHHARLPLALLFLGAAAVVLVFWYSPRYRLPLVPIAAILAPWAALQLAKSQPKKIAAYAIAPILFLEL